MRRLALATGLVAVGVTAFASAGFGQRGSEPIRATRFSLTIDGYELGSFQEMVGVLAEADPETYWEGEGVPPNKLPGRLKPPAITLKRGLNGNLELWRWAEAVRSGTMGAARKNVSLTAFNAEGRPVAKYWLEKAWPMKMALTGTEAGEARGEFLIEEVTLTAAYVQRIAP